MRAYGPAFARIYNTKWAGFARQVGPRLVDFYAGTPVARANRSVLDLCCGTGQLALLFLERGYRVTGMDLSEHMLRHAVENAGRYVDAGQARFLVGDAARFVLDEPVGLVVSTYDSLNHLFNTVFELEAVRAALLETGFRTAHFARIDDLASPLDDPEREGRVFVAAGT